MPAGERTQMDKPRNKIENILGKLNDEDRSKLAGLLIKAGYAVKIGKEVPEGKKTARYYVEYWEE